MAPDDALLLREAKVLKAARKKAGTDKLLKGLAGIIIRVQEGTVRDSVKELISTTSLEHTASFSHEGYSQAVLQAEKCPTFIVRESREFNPFWTLNSHPRTVEKPDSRLETFVFETTDIEELVKIQRARGVSFSSEITDMGSHLFIRTRPSPSTHNSVGYVQFKGEKTLIPKDAKKGISIIPKPKRDYLGQITILDHAATRITYLDRIPAILEWMNLTGYDFSESVYAACFNSITNVTRLQGKDFAMVFTSGIRPYTGDPSVPEPTEKFVINYGKRVHHLAWQATDVGKVFHGLEKDGQKFLIELVGGPKEGLMQTFTRPSPNTFLVQEYIHRYGDFDGFFTKHNVTKLTGATDRQ